MKKRKGVKKTALIFLTFWAVLVFACNLAIEHNVLRHFASIKPWEKIAVIIALPSLVVLVAIPVYALLHSISNSVTLMGYHE